MWFMSTIGRFFPLPEIAAMRFARPGANSSSVTAIASFSSASFRNRAPRSSLPGGLVVSTCRYRVSSSTARSPHGFWGAASRASARKQPSIGGDNTVSEVTMLRRALLPLCFAALADAESRPVTIDDMLAVQDVEAPQLSPDGKWVAYSVESVDVAKDESNKDIWMVPFAGGDAVRLTSSPKSESRPKWSPDGRYLAFLSGREGEKTQVYVLDRQGGEAQRLTSFAGGVSTLVWSPDGTRLALVVS